ncbi:RNA 2',3'-cyclic phosphodiesterase [bacterium]|nr:RNA 2',3'-cyclic phosphodiesterase [bacterium]
MIRAFIAIDLTDEVRAALATAQDRLRRLPLGVRVSWVKLANLHLTLQFLGYVAEDVVPAVGVALGAVVRCHAPFNLGVNGLGAFPDPGRPRVLWAGCDAGTAEIAGLARAVQQATQPLGFTPETRPFAAHLTIGRVKVPRPDCTLTRALDSLKNAAFGTVRVEALHLYQSELHPAGSIYTKLSSHPLTGD